VQNRHIETEIRLNLALLPYKSRYPNFEERAWSLSVLLTLTDAHKAREMLNTWWQKPDSGAIEAWRERAGDTKALRP
jgi:hypothetical protein